MGGKVTKKVKDMTEQEMLNEFFIEKVIIDDEGQKKKVVINKFNNKKRTYEERVKYIEDVREVMAIFNIPETNYDKDNWGSYLLWSKDIESHRKIENTFFINDKDAIGYAEFYKSITVDFTDQEALENRIQNNNTIAYTTEYIDTLFKNGDISVPEKRSLLKNYVQYYDKISDESIKDNVDFVLEEIYLNIKDEKDSYIIEHLINGLSESEMECSLGISQQAINKRISRLLG